MIDVATLKAMGLWALREQLSTREIAHRTGLPRNTVRKYLRAGRVEPHGTKRGSSKPGRFPSGSATPILNAFITQLAGSTSNLYKELSRAFNSWALSIVNPVAPSTRNKDLLKGRYNHGRSSMASQGDASRLLVRSQALHSASRS